MLLLRGSWWERNSTERLGIRMGVKWMEWVAIAGVARQCHFRFCFIKQKLEIWKDIHHYKQIVFFALVEIE